MNLPPWSYHGQKPSLANHDRETVILFERLHAMHEAELGWNHSRNCPLYRENCGFFLYKIIILRRKGHEFFPLLLTEKRAAG
jgi:hypothetical protein